MISDSPSGVSKGIRLVAAMPAVRNRTKASGCVTIPHAGSHPQNRRPCARRMEVLLREHLDRVGERVEQAQQAEPEDRRAVGADAVLHDRRLLALDPREEPAKVEDEEHDEGDAPEGDAEVRGAHWSGVREAGCDRGWPAIGAFSTAPVSPMAW